MSAQPHVHTHVQTHPLVENPLGYVISARKACDSIKRFSAQWRASCWGYWRSEEAAFSSAKRASVCRCCCVSCRSRNPFQWLCDMAGASKVQPQCAVQVQTQLGRAVPLPGLEISTQGEGTEVVTGTQYFPETGGNTSSPCEVLARLGLRVFHGETAG